MRTVSYTLLLTALIAGLSTNLQADENAEKARKIIDQGVKALGGAKALAKTKNMIMTDEGIYYGMGQGVPYKGRFVLTYGKKHQYRFEIVGAFVQVYNGDKGWFSANGNTMEMNGEQLKAVKQTTETNYVTSMIPLAKANKKYKLSLAGDETIDGDECVGVNITKKGNPEVTIYFSKKTGLPRKTSYTVKAEEQGFKEVVEDVIYGEYKEEDGFKTPRTVTINRDGKKYVESKVLEIEHPESIDESEFAKP